MKIWTKINFLAKKIFLGGRACALHGKNLAKKSKILKFFLMCIWTQVRLSIISKKILKFFIFWPNFFHETHTPNLPKFFFPPKSLFLSIFSFWMSIFIVKMCFWHSKMQWQNDIYSAFPNLRCTF